jgi:hypothetical protein
MSYFYEYKRPISYINTTYSKPHLTYIGPIDDEDNLLLRCHRKNYVREINKWLNNNLINSDYYKIEDNKQFVKNNNLKIKDVCKVIYDDILKVVEESGFEIFDLNQFKEDLIHYIYILSDTRET